MELKGGIARKQTQVIRGSNSRTMAALKAVYQRVDRAAGHCIHDLLCSHFSARVCRASYEGRAHPSWVNELLYLL